MSFRVGIGVLLMVSMTFALTVKGPKSLHDKICIVGAGPSGIHMALSLKERGFTNIVILEKNSFVGGKSWTINHRGVAHEMGSVYLAPDYEDNVIPLVNKYMPNDLVILPPSAVWMDDLPGPIPYEQYLIGYAMKFFGTNDIRVAGGKLGQTIVQYIAKHNEIFGAYEGDLMPEPTPDNKVKIQGTFVDFLSRNNMLAMQCILYASSSVQGYGRLDEIPALYGLMWNTPKLMASLLQRLSGNTNGTGLYMLRHGFKTLWERIIQAENLDVRFSSEIYRLYRSKTEPKVWLEVESSGTRKFNSYDFLIWSPEMKTSLPLWDANVEERFYFSRSKPAFFTTALVDTDGELRAPSPIDYWFDNINKKRQHSLWALRDSYGALHGYSGAMYQSKLYPSGNDGKQTRSQVTYQMGDEAPVYTELRHTLLNAMKTDLQASSVNVLYMKTWRYFPRFSHQDLADGMLWRILEMQGNHGMWYIGSSVSFESVKSVVEYNKLLLKHFTVPTS
ncbi:uncharacterized protein [Clytia hemisphaerica]|uniref:Amine oxidase domain-containing protein n=1 Tax=Clytia hemisphaerica TaxID=252671 RepID=A0A7M5WU38_9CNID|eukprot:TCONS_00054429-protein